MADVVLAGILSCTLSLLLLSSCLLLPAAAMAIDSSKLQLRSPHGLPFEHPMPFPPSALEFFHPKAAGGHAALLQPAAAPTSTLFGPAAAASKARADVAVVASTIDAPNSTRRRSSPGGGGGGGGGVGAGGAAAVVIGAVFMVLLAVFASYVALRRRGNLNKANADVKRPPDV